MQQHTKIYMSHFGYGEQSFIYCEVCYIVSDIPIRANDTQHIEPRGMGGSKKKDYISNLMAVCRLCHNDCENGLISKDKQKEIHLAFMEKFSQ